MAKTGKGRRQVNDHRNFAQSLHSRVETAILEALEQNGVTFEKKNAYRAARDVVLDVLYEWGGDQMYLPVKSEFLYEAVLEEMANGARASDVARKYRLATNTVYRIFRLRKKSPSKRVPNRSVAS